MNPKSKEYKALERVWYKKLKKSGFEDIEAPDTKSLRQFHSVNFFNSGNRNPLRQASKEEYYRLAGHFLHSHTFQSHDEKVIWELHCEGKAVSHYRSKKIRCQSTAHALLDKLRTTMKESWKK